MSTYTVTFCDVCNYDHETERGDDDSHAVYHDDPGGAPYHGWAIFLFPRKSEYSSFVHHEETHVCAHCLAAPKFDGSVYGEVGTHDAESKANVAKGRERAETFRHAQETLGTWDERWRCWNGVRQHLGEHRCYLPQPKPQEARDAA